MWAVLFEVQPHAERAPRYFDLAATLRRELEGIDGFLSVERFESLSRPGVFLSLSYWRDEAAIARWRGTLAHREAQREGRAEVFAGYRIRVAQVMRSYGLDDRDQAPPDSAAALP